MLCNRCGTNIGEQPGLCARCASLPAAGGQTSAFERERARRQNTDTQSRSRLYRRLAILSVPAVIACMFILLGKIGAPPEHLILERDSIRTLKSKSGGTWLFNKSANLQVESVETIKISPSELRVKVYVRFLGDLSRKPHLTMKPASRNHSASFATVPARILSSTDEVHVTARVHRSTSDEIFETSHLIIEGYYGDDGRFFHQEPFKFSRLWCRKPASTFSLGRKCRQPWFSTWDYNAGSVIEDMFKQAT